MSFTRATIVIKPAAIGTGIKVGLRRTKKNAASMTVYLTGEGVKALGVGDGDKCEVLIGDGEHHGLIRLRKNNSAAGEAPVSKRETGKGAFYTIKLGHQAAFVDRTEQALWCQWEAIEEGWIEIVMPKWADETAPTQRSVIQGTPGPKPLTPAQQAIQRGKAKNVTSSVMGDPPPGRREMLEKMGSMKA
jgi:hypothetical protein